MAVTVFSNAALASKFRGCMIGCLVGDCLGCPFEFHYPKSTELNNFFSSSINSETDRILPYTDDTSMALSIASSLIEKGQFDAKDIAKRFVAAYYKEAWRNYGCHVPRVFEVLKKNNFEDVFQPAKLQFNGEGSYGNGAAMRIAPIPLFYYSKGEQCILDFVEKCSCITHAHKDGINGAKLISLAINTVLGLDSAQDLDPVNFIDNLQEKMQNIEMKDKKKPYCECLKKIKDMFSPEVKDMTSMDIAEHLGNGEPALLSVPTAIFCFLRGIKPLKDYETSNPFMRTVYFAISVGGDTDTIAAMAGSIAGAYYGADIIPEMLQKKCEKINEVVRCADELFKMSQG